MSALIIIMLWVGLCLAVQFFNDRKIEAKERRVKRIEKKVYDFDILSYEDDFSELRKSA